MVMEGDVFLTLSRPLEGSCDISKSKVVSRILIVFINHCSMLHKSALNITVTV
jgi:hypothetical protein